MSSPVFDTWLSEQQTRRDDIGELATRLVNNPTFEEDFYFSNSLSQKVEWMFNQNHSRRDVLNLVRAFEEWMGGQEAISTAS